MKVENTVSGGGPIIILSRGRHVREGVCAKARQSYHADHARII